VRHRKVFQVFRFIFERGLLCVQSRAVKCSTKLVASPSRYSVELFICVILHYQ